MDMTTKIRLNQVSDVKDFAKLTSDWPWKQELRSGRYIVDAKSILGIMSLDLSKPVEYWCEEYEPELKHEIDKYAVQTNQEVR